MRMRLQILLPVGLAALVMIAQGGCKTEPATGGDSATAPSTEAAESGATPAADEPVEEGNATAIAPEGLETPDGADAEPKEAGPDTEGDEAKVAAADGAEAGDGADEAKTDEEGEPEDAANAEGLKLLILGDSLAATGFGVLLEKRLDAQPGVTCFRKGKSASGLARPDFYDWMDMGKRQVEWREPDYVVVIMGGNDGQDLTSTSGKGRRVRWKTEGWPDAYRERVSKFLGRVTAGGAKVIWLSLPPMGLTSLEKKLVMIRGLQKEAVDELGKDGVYVDLAPYLTDDEGGMLKKAEVKGKSRAIRAEDRIHFTMSGSEYLADLVYPEILKIAGREVVQPGE